MNVTLDQIKSLRERTGVSTMACKAALVEANGDEEMAIEILRKKGADKIADRAERSTAHGVVAIVEEEGKVAMLALGCETDFVAKNEDFLSKAQSLVTRLFEEGMDADIDSEIKDLNLQMGEKVEVKERIVVQGGMVGSYLHSNKRIGVVVQLKGGDFQKAKNTAMHAAATNPKYLSPDDVSQESVAKEKGIWSEQLKAEGKPAQIMDKIMMGKEKKFREENALLTQAFVVNPDQTIQQMLEGADLVAFYRFEV
jgi:elongation factor Ts